MNKKEVKYLIDKFEKFSINKKREFIEAFSDIGGFDIDIKDLVIDTKVNYRKNKEGEYKAKIDIPNEWLDSLGITRYDNDITIKLSENNIIINKYQYGCNKEYEYDEDIEYLEIEGYEHVEEITSKERVELLLIENRNRAIARSLIEKGKSTGYLTISEIMEAFSNTKLDRNKVEILYETLGNLGIEIIENIETIDEDDFEESIDYDDIDYDDTENFDI